MKRNLTSLALFMAGISASPSFANEAVLNSGGGGGFGSPPILIGNPVNQGGSPSEPPWLNPVPQQNPLDFPQPLQQVPIVNNGSGSNSSSSGSFSQPAFVQANPMASAGGGTRGNGTYHTGEGKQGEYHTQAWDPTDKQLDYVKQGLHPVGTQGLAPVFGMGGTGISPGGYDPLLFGFRIPTSFFGGILNIPGLTGGNIMGAAGSIMSGGGLGNALFGGGGNVNNYGAGYGSGYGSGSGMGLSSGGAYNGGYTYQPGVGNLSQSDLNNIANGGGN
jgi:hypothetical protein